MHPIVAIVGRPNVGKSRLFNRLIGQSRAIVADVAGVTRDRHYAPAEWAGREFIVVDTGGLEFDPSFDLEHAVSRQSLRAVEEADIIVCLFDGQQDEPAVADREVVQELRRCGKPVVFVVNKIDEVVHEDRLQSYSTFGLDSLIGVSAEHGRNIGDLLDAITAFFPEPSGVVDEEDDDLRVAVVGRPNVGKSTIINRLAGDERVVAHEMSGTTRDAIDVEIDFEGTQYVFIDTAGVKRRLKNAEKLERFTAMRSLRAVDRANVICQLIDVGEGLTKQDLHLAGFVREEGKGLILLANKWDLVGGDWKEYEADLRYRLGEFKDVPILPVSAKTGFGCLKIFTAIDRVAKALAATISTSELNRIVEHALQEHHLPVFRGKQVNIKYATQVGTHPPTIALFANYPAAVPYTYRRYLIKRLQEAMNAQEVPVRVVCKRK